MAKPVTAELLRTTAIPSGAVDPNVKIPAAIVRAGQQADEIQRAAYPEQAQPPAEPPPAEPPAGDPPPAAPPLAEPPPVTPPSNAEPDGPVDWEQRYKRLEGRHNADTKRNRDAIATLSDQLERANMELVVLRNQQPPPPPAPGEQPQSLISEQELQDYGPELVDIMRRVAAETAAPLNAEIMRLRQGLGQVQQETGNSFLNRMNDTIGKAVPNWEQINSHPDFIAWSQLPDVFSGAIRKGLMQDAWNSGDANRVIAFFRAFLAEEAALHPPGGNGQARTVPRTVVGDTSILPPAAPAEPDLDLAHLASPGRAHSVGAAPTEQRVYTTAEITRFYTEVAAGKWRGRDQQRMAIDADIIQAQREGRIILNQRTQLPMDPRTR